eukprot:6702778-Pyramimonas_sp.AAC.1
MSTRCSYPDATHPRLHNDWGATRGAALLAPRTLPQPCVGSRVSRTAAERRICYDELAFQSTLNLGLPML